ncbi:16S rRNA (guanine(966)-N(2))-methyltransferase RsmD [bacterium]|nr:16S rRNA (guanine(966)-N(2))-methyltransferase RsmD [candidate division CSSED10-310 bacterium]
MKQGPRIMSGRYAGRCLPQTDDERVRPTTERVRRSFFDLIHDQVMSCRFIDGFAGTGIMGFEAVSRGCPEVVFLEREQHLCRRIDAIIAELGCHGVASVICGDIRRTLSGSIRDDVPAIVFFDPPYALSIVPDLLPEISRADRCRNIRWVVVEHHHKTDPAVGTTDWRIDRREKYGETTLTFLGPKTL